MAKETSLAVAEMHEPACRVANQWLGRDTCANCSIRPLTICAPLNKTELDDMARIVTSRSFTSGSIIFEEGDPAQHVFNVTSGVVKIYRLFPDGRRQVIGFLFPGDFLGLTGSTSSQFSFSAETLTETDLCRFERSKLEMVLTKYPKLEKRLLTIAANELAVAQDQMALLGRKTAQERVASFILDLSRRAQKRGQAENPVHIPMNRTDIADYLGLTTETVSRTFTNLRNKGSIRNLQGGKTSVEDWEMLENIANGEA